MKKNKKSRRNRVSNRPQTGGYISITHLMKTATSGLGNIDYDKLINTVDWNRIKQEQDKSLPKLLCTNSPMEEENFAKLPEAIKDKLQELGQTVAFQPEFVLNQLQVLKKDYPNIPMIYNILGNAHMVMGNVELFYQTNKEAATKFPHYLFAKTSLADYYLRKEQFDEFYKLFQGKFHIHQHFPETKKAYHVSEVRSFYSVVGIYHAVTGNISQALWCYHLMTQIEGKTSHSNRVAQAVVMAEMKLVLEKLGRI